MAEKTKLDERLQREAQNDKPPAETLSELRKNFTCIYTNKDVEISEIVLKILNSKS